MTTKIIPVPSFDRLDELLTYDPEDGQLRWKINRSNLKAGRIVGYIRTDKNGRRERKIQVDGKRYFSSRIIWMMYHHEDPGPLTIDHLDRDPLNNRITNLRLATAHEQAMNKRCTSPSTATRYIGVGMDSHENERRRPQWHGKIRISGHYYSFGSAAVNSINDPAPQWLIDRAARLYSMRDDPAISDEALISLITG